MPSTKEEEWLQSYIMRRLAELEKENQRLQDVIHMMSRQRQEQDREQ